MKTKSTPAARRQIMLRAEGDIESPGYRRVIDDLRASERRFRDLVEGSIQGILIHRDFVPLFVNRACAEILGYANSREVMAVASLDRLLAADECRRIRRFAKERMQGKDVPPRYEVRARRKDGSLIWLELRPCVVEWDGHEAIQVSMVDIDERKRAEAELQEAHANLERLVEERTRELAEEVAAHRRTEESLRESEARFKALFDNAPEALNLKDAEGRYLLVNRAWEQQHAATSREAQGKTSVEVFGREMGERLAGIEGEVVATGETRTFETSVRLADGQWQTRLITKFPIRDAKGRISGVGTVGSDITERKAMEKALRDTEARFKALFDHLPVSTNLKDKAGRYVMVNAAWESQHGVDRREVEGRTARDVFDAETAKRLKRVEGKVFRTGMAQTSETEMTLPDGSRWTRLVTKFPVRDADGAVVLVGTAGIDITERKAMEKALRDSEEQFRALLDNSPLFIHLKDAEGRFQLINREFERQHGLKQADVVGRTARELFPEESAAAIDAADRQTLETGETTVFEVSFRLPNGKQRTHLGTKFAIRDASGAITRIGTVGMDITERKAMEKALRDSEEQLRAILDNAPVAISLKDAKGRFLLVNRQFQRQHGFSARNVVGRTARDFFGPENAASIGKAEREILASGESRTFELDVTMPGGEVQTHFITKFPVRDSDGAITRLGTISLDISARKRAEDALRAGEARFRALIDNAQAVIDLKDREGRYLMVNAEYERCFGVPAERAIGATARDFVPPEAADDIERRERMVRDSGRPVVAEVAIDHKKNGAPAIYHIVKFPIFDDKGRTAQIGTFGIDITERKRAEQALKASEARFRALIDHAQAIVTLKDLDGRYLLVNREFERCYGVSPGQVIGLRVADLVSPERAEDIERREKQVRDSGKAVVDEVTVTQPDSETQIIYHALKFPVFDDEGRVIQTGTFSLDITERKRAEQALKASEEWFRDFAESTSDWLWESDPEGRLTYVSERLRDIFGEAPSALIGRRRSDIAAAGQNDRLKELERLMEAHQPIRNFRYEAMSTLGRRFWVRITGRPRFSPDGAFLGYRGTGTDISEEVAALHREAQVTERFLAAIETVAVAVALFDEQDRLVVANKGYRAQLLTADRLRPGITFEEMLRAETDAGAYPESYGNKEEWIRDRLRRHREPSGRFELAKSNGFILQIREHRTADGYTLVVAYDITASKQAEQALIAARDDLEMRVRERTYALEQEIIERQYAEQALQDANAELERRVEERTRHLRDEIAERKKMEAQFLQAQKMEAVGQLAGGIAHDFNNLLTVIQGNLSWLHDVVKGDAKTTRLMGMALEAARRAGQLTHRMLAFSRRQDLRPERVDLRKTLDGMEPLIARALSEAVKLQIIVDDDHWPLMVDAHQLESAILNIAINARDAMPNGGAFVLQVENRVVTALEASAFDDVEPGDYVRLSMADSGSGMSPDVLERVFDPFFTTKEVGKGSGLGLSMVFGFVNQSGGFIEISSVPGEGTVVGINLPRSREAAADDIAPVQDAGLSALPNLSILVVEDDSLVRGVAVEYLRMSGIQTLQASDGHAAVGILEQADAVDLVLTDVIMPGGMSGLDLAEVVRKRWPDTSILFMSGYSYDEFARHGIDPDTISLLRKPFTKRELLGKVQEAVASAGGRD